MFGLPPDIVAWLAFAIFIGGLAKGISGVALPITTLAIALQFVDPKVGLALLALPILLANVWQTFGNGDILGPAKRFWIMAIVFLVSLYIGSRLVQVVETWVMFAAIGSTALIFACSQFYKPRADALTPRQEKIMGPLAGLVGGVMGGMTSVWGPPIIMFFFMLKLDKDMWVRSVTGIYMLGAAPLVFFYYQNGVLAGEMMWLSAAACVPVMLGILIGERIRKYINEDLFRKILLFAIFFVGLNMIRRAVMAG